MILFCYFGAKGIINNIGKGNVDPAAVFSISTGGIGLLHCAACRGHLEVCKYLVEELGGDPNMSVRERCPMEGMTPLMAAAQSGDVSTVKYFLNHGGDPMKTDGKGRTVLHYAVCTGSCKVTEFLLSIGIPVDIDCGGGTPLYHAATNEQDKTLKILLDHHANAGADVNGKGSFAPPLVFATDQGGYTDFIRLLLKAGANPNIPDDLGRLPIQLAAIRECREEVEMLLPLTSPLPNVPNWSIDGVISYAKFQDTKPLVCYDKGLIEGRRAMLKSQANWAFRQKEYEMASKLYSMVIHDASDATLYSNRSLCKLKLGDGEGALSDAYKCRIMRPDWAKACYRQAAAHMLLQVRYTSNDLPEYSINLPEECGYVVMCLNSLRPGYKQAYDALLDAQKLDPGNDEIERELRKAMESMKLSPDADQQ
ncbi:hypothetical protein PR202_ga04402 [Eleusine coracana subsp. coracana]|uniref:Serine/threonine-protein kinase BSK1-like TPR repeats domain-containing protein n=1 Tax=Eleusine coracana subsp. coracana TaxID=191504 RepID=A0AAV5BPK2_ELECO|nr:hypothetical protein PR202_ga04402 [Eleusine coracana subsp. coracana]